MVRARSEFRSGVEAWSGLKVEVEFEEWAKVQVVVEFEV